MRIKVEDRHAAALESAVKDGLQLAFTREEETAYCRLPLLGDRGPGFDDPPRTFTDMRSPPLRYRTGEIVVDFLIDRQTCHAV